VTHESELKRILFLSHYALPHLGGIEVVVDALARELTAMGYDVTHVASDVRREGETDTPSSLAAGYRLVRVPAWNGMETWADVPWPVFAPEIVPTLAREVANADVVHAHGLLYLNSVLGILLAHRKPAIRVVTEHVGHVKYASRIVDGLQKTAIATLGRLTARSAQAIVVLNEKVRAEMLALTSTREIACIPNGVDMTCYRPGSPSEKAVLREDLGWDATPRALFVGRLVQKKGVDLAVAAAARLKGKVRLVVVGPGKLPPSPYVEVLGPQPRWRVAELYRAADIFLLPSRGEGFPLTAQEAMASGLPAILGDDSAYARYLVAEGIRLAELEPEALADAILSLLDPEIRQRAGMAALRKAQTDFSWRTAAEAHVQLYESLATQARTREGIRRRI
jgi:D-inositol-3-phosphate glycosyltransferase